MITFLASVLHTANVEITTVCRLYLYVGSCDEVAISFTLLDYVGLALHRFISVYIMYACLTNGPEILRAVRACQETSLLR